jgi:DNA invertase Pin-like site-specific DNA recombinase
MIYGYSRVSTVDQDLSIQHAALTAAGCTMVRSEKVSGTSTEGRQELATLLQFLREGDTLVVTRVDRLARSLRDLQNIVHDLGRRSVTLKATEQPIDTGDGRGEVLPRHAGGVCRVRDQSPERVPDGRHRQSEGERHLCRQA